MRVDSACCTEYYVRCYDWQKLHRWGDWQPQSLQRLQRCTIASVCSFHVQLSVSRVTCPSSNARARTPACVCRRKSSVMASVTARIIQTRGACVVSCQITSCLWLQSRGSSPPPPTPSIWLLCTNMSHMARSGCCMLNVNLKTEQKQFWSTLSLPFHTLANRSE